MTRTIIALGTAVFLATSFSAQAESHSDCESMLTHSVGMALSSEGFDTSGVCDLTVSQLATIKGLLETDGMNSSTRGRIEKILAGE